MSSGRSVWMADANPTLPLKTKREEIRRRAASLSIAADRAQIQLVSVDSVVVLPDEFNRLLSRFDNKANVLSLQTMGVASRLMQLADDDLEVVCDKHGGRSRYARLIQQTLTDSLVSVGAENRHQSDYSFRAEDRDVVVRFCRGGESFLPTALASMISKYLREVFMKVWNDFWSEHVSNLKPTRGYPVDAKRFKADINATQHRLGIPDRDIWRQR